MQVFGPDSLAAREGLVKYLRGVPHPDATRALARLALFSPEVELREAAVDAVKVRREKDYTDILLQGFRYPWPEVAGRAAELATMAERKDLVADLVNLLDLPDPRVPWTAKEDGKEVYRARQLVSVNHHRNCMLCHAPAKALVKKPMPVLVAPIPVSSQEILPFAHYYDSGLPQLSVRAEVTYLRQDFSILQKVRQADPWPEMQRFDYLVRTVTLTKEQAKMYESKVLAALDNQGLPYRGAALAALRSLTGQDHGKTAAAWRKALKLPE